MNVTVFGSINMDMVMPVTHLPRPGETVAARGLSHLPGGKGANQAVASARSGASTRMVGAVGDDAFGATMLAFLAAEQVDIGGIARLASPTGIAHVFLSDDGENQIVIVAGANGLVTAPAGEAVVSTSRHPVALAQLEVPLAAVSAFLGIARRSGATTILNAAPAQAAAAPLLGAADIVVVNETELAFFLGAPLPDDRDGAAVAARLLRHRDDQWIVVTLGANGIVAVRGDETIIIAAPRVSVVDTTGAGDTFCGVLAGCLSEGAVMADALGIACTAASLAVQAFGAAVAMPRRAEIERAVRAASG